MWGWLGAKVTGAAHIRAARPCQDAIRIEEYNDGYFVVAAVADGHGSSACPFSADGAAAAVDCVHELLSDIITEAGEQTGSVIENTREIRLPKQLAALWRRRVEEIHAEAGRDEFSYVFYGTTVLAVAVAPEFIFALQLGDGDILVAEDDEPPSWLIEPEYLPGNETHSLCMEDCWRYIKTRMLGLTDGCKPPGMIMLTTDGYSNSFAAQSGFAKAGEDILGILRAEGAEYVRENLEGWLERSSAEGSGDDISMALVYTNE